MTGSCSSDCISNAETVTSYAKKFFPEHWIFLDRGRTRDGLVTHDGLRPCSQQHGITIQRNWSSDLYKNQCFESWNLEEDKRHKYHSLQWAFCEAVTDWCYQFGWTRKKGAILLDNGVLTTVEPNVGISSEPDTWKQYARKRKLPNTGKRVQMTQCWEKALFRHLVTAGSCYQIRPDGSNGLGHLALPCREYTSSRVFLKNQSGDIPLEPELLGHVLNRRNWKKYMFHRGLSCVEMLSTRTRPCTLCILAQLPCSICSFPH